MEGWGPAQSCWNTSYSSHWVNDHHRHVSESPSLDDSLSKSSSFSLSSLSSSDKEKTYRKVTQLNNEATSTSDNDVKPAFTAFSRQVSQVSNSTSLPSWSGSELPNSSSVSQFTSTEESTFDDGSVSIPGRSNRNKTSFKDYQYSDIVGPTRRRSSLSDILLSAPYSSKKSGDDTMKTNREKRKHRDIIIQDDEEDPYPFAKYTFNKKSEKAKNDDSMSTVSSMSTRSSSQESIFSVGLMKQYITLKNGKMPVMNKRSSTSSMMSSQTSSFNDQSVASFSAEDNSASHDYESFEQEARLKASEVQYRKSPPNLFLKIPPAPMQNPYNFQMYNFPQVPTPSPEQLLNSMGFNEAQSILPERFLKSWIEKALQTQQQEYVRYMMSAPHPPPPVVSSSLYDNPYYVDDSDLPPSISAQQSVATTPQYQSSLENIYGAEKLFQQSHSRFQRSNTFNSSIQNLNKSKMNGFLGNGDDDICPSADDCDNADLSSIGALPLKKENSFDKLKRILHSSIPLHQKSFRRSAFAANHQKSLPISLQTLTEEDEEKRRSRTPSFDKNSTKSNGASKMKSFLEEEEKNASRGYSSDTNSDFSHNSSFSGHIEAKDSCTCSEYSLKCKCFSPVEDTAESVTEEVNQNEKFKMNIPSIIVSEKEVPGEDSTDIKKKNVLLKLETEARNESFLPVIVEEACSSASSERLSRPSSPNPDTQDEHSAYNQGHNYEIAEIMDRRNIQDKGRKLSGTRRGSKEFENFSFEVHATKPGQFLSISTSDVDDKHLSPTPSLSSPNLMSPVTVIEVNKLDNQNDSLELDDNKTSEQMGTRHNSAGTADSRSQTGTVKHAKFHGIKDLISHKSCHKRKRSRKHQAPKCLTLKRHLNNCDTSSGKESTSDSENVFLDLSAAVEETEKHNIEVQADDDSLCPIIMISDVADLLRQLSQSLPELIEKPLFVLAHDRAIQCNLQCEGDYNDRMNDRVTITEKQLEISETPNYFSFHVPLNHVYIEKELNETDHSCGNKMTDNFCQTAENDFTFVGSRKMFNRPPHLISPVPVVSTHPERSYLSVKNFFVDNFEEVNVSIQVPEVFKSEKTIALKHKQTVDKVLPIFTCDIEESDTSLRSEQMVMITETSCDIHSEGNELGNIAVNTTDCNKCSNHLDISPERDTKLYISKFLHHGCSDSLERERYGNERCSQQSNESRSITSADKPNMKSSPDSDREGKNCEKNEKDKCEIANRNKASSGSVNLFDERDTSFNEFSLYGMNHAHRRRSIRSYENNVNNENHVNSLNEKDERTHQIDHFIEKNSVKETQVYHTECYICPKLSLESIEYINDCRLGSKLKDTYSSSVFVKLKTPSTDTCRENEFCRNKVHLITSYNSYEKGRNRSDRNQSVSLDYESESGECKIFEEDAFSDSDQQFVEKKDNSMHSNENNSEDNTEPHKESYSYENIELQRIIKGNEDYEDNEGDSDKIDFNVSHEGKTNEAGKESKSKVRKNSLLRKFRALIGQRVDEVEKVDTSSNELITQSESRDPKSQVISTRSLDFETIGSRKNILHRCLKTGFAKSFDASGIDLKTVQNKETFSVENNQIMDSKSTDLCIIIDETENQPTCIKDRTDKVSPDSLIDSDIEKSECKETEFEIKDYYQSDECDKVMYQVGLNYNVDEKCYDVYGRVKIYREDRPAAFNKDNNAKKLGVTKDSNECVLNDVFCLTEANVMKLISGEMQEMADNNPIENILTELNRNKEERQNFRQNDIKEMGLRSVDVKNGNQHFEEQRSKSDSQPSKRLSERQMFDMFQQVRDEEEDFLHNDSEFGSVLFKDDNESNCYKDSCIDDVRTRKTLEKIERLYNLSVYDQNNIPEQFEMDTSEGDDLYENGNNLDIEMKFLDSYYDEYELTETHTCRNCGHSVTMETSGRYDVGEVVEHDFCCKCSPLKFTVEMLESRRIQRMNEENDCFNLNFSTKKV